MKKSLILIIFMILATCATIPVFAQQTVPVTIEDLKNFRVAVVERDSLKAENQELKNQLTGWQQSSANWQNLYNQEKLRADNVLTKAIQECDASKRDLTLANTELHTQHDTDKQRISQLEFDVAKYKGERKWYFAAGATGGLALGALGGYEAGKKFNF